MDIKNMIGTSFRTMSTQPQFAQIKNWQNNLTFETEKVVYPDNLDELRTVLKQNQHVKVQGTSASFVNSADSTSDGVIIKLDHLT